MPVGHTTNAMTALTRALFVSAALLLPFLSACSADPGDSAASANAAASAAPSCNSSAVMTAVSEKLGKWLDQQVIRTSYKGLSVDLHAKFGLGVSSGVTVADLQAGVTVGGRPGTEQCKADASVNFSDAGGTDASAQFSVEFLLNDDDPNGPQVTLNDASLLHYDGAFSTTASVLAEAVQCARDGYPMIYYASVVCFSNPGCSPPAPDDATYRSAHDCISAMMTDRPDGRLIGNRLSLDALTGTWLECYEKSASSQWEPLPRNAWLDCYNAESSKEAPAAAALKCYSSSPVRKLQHRPTAPPPQHAGLS